MAKEMTQNLQIHSLDTSPLRLWFFSLIKGVLEVDATRWAKQAAKGTGFHLLVVKKNLNVTYNVSLCSLAIAVSLKLHTLISLQSDHIMRIIPYYQTQPLVNLLFLYV